MTVLLHLSDMHFGTERAEVVDALTRFAQRLGPALVVASGDITQRARPAQFAQARRFIDALGAPALVLPGNHDIPLFDVARRAFAPYSRFEAAFGRGREPRVVLPTVWVAGVRTTRAWRHKHGQVSADQAEAAAAWLQGAPAGVLRVVVTHQPLAWARDADRNDRLRGGREAARIWAAAGVHLVLGGHIHLPYFMPVDGLWRELPRRLWLAQAGTAVSCRVRPEAGNSVNLVRQIGLGRWRLERWDHDAARDDFVFAPHTPAVEFDA
jgi:3',5'-cyclic AMP phosphodiesterase CpdA